MPKYDFILTFNLPDTPVNLDHYLETLAIEGCDDALIGIGKKGRIALNFIRESSSATEAVYSAIRDVKRAIPQAVLIEVSPDFVSLTEVAKLLGCTRQNIRNLMMKDELKSPQPIYGGTPSIWHLSDILHWLCNEKNYRNRIKPNLLELSKVNKDLNIAREWETVNSEEKQKMIKLFSQISA
ncbi:Prophage CP4-57 regulatory [Planktothrix tepida]|uniref:Prophage CP4-57 regulatory n=1 Tax=Planktothrix tepida PCC 9214 TaxID=671072 RepID=A0A1J1LJS7_9CYAN|nr:DNA-binding protein [Planktothrix tepida]CAD5984674.1 Prophage CP4-57 regulatory [Planktothrix tepida]CUR32164.1 Prophage CP4-57 regulatory [Planktothrix tepida PCC 9214]